MQFQKTYRGFFHYDASDWSGFHKQFPLPESPPTSEFARRRAPPRGVEDVPRRPVLDGRGAESSM